MGGGDLQTLHFLFILHISNLDDNHISFKWPMRVKVMKMGSYPSVYTVYTLMLIFIHFPLMFIRFQVNSMTMQ